MDRNFELAAKNWMNQCGADLKGKIDNLLTENDSTPDELAETINVDVDEIYAILDEEVENISVETLIKVFMVLGLAVEIKPINQTPLRTYENVNPHVMEDIDDENDFHEEVRTPRPNPFARPSRPMGGMPPREFDPSRIPPHFREQMERDMAMGGMHGVGRRPMGAPNPRHEEKSTSPFATKTRDELTHIIRKHLWDTEIDIENAPKEALVRFLDEKDKRTKEFKRNEEVERDPRVAEFVKNMKKTIKENPQFRSYMKNFLGELDKD